MRTNYGELWAGIVALFFGVMLLASAVIVLHWPAGWERNVAAGVCGIGGLSLAIIGSHKAYWATRWSG